MRNFVQVFGLPRSGTNFIEWTLNNNFIGVDYKNIYVNTPTRRIPVKHTLPNLNYSDFIIVIYKDKTNWEESMRKDSKALKEWPNYDTFLKVASELPRDKTIIVEHKWAYENYFLLLNKIVEKTGLTLINNPIQPKGYFNKGGAKASFNTKKVYIYDNSNTKQL